jgi:hypothetical protein
MEFSDMELCLTGQRHGHAPRPASAARKLVTRQCYGHPLIRAYIVTFEEVEEALGVNHVEPVLP